MSAVAGSTGFLISRRSAACASRGTPRSRRENPLSSNRSTRALGTRRSPSVGKPAREALVPNARRAARHRRCAARSRAILRHAIVGTTRVTSRFPLLPPRRISGLPQDLERDGGADETTSRHLRIRHHQSEALDRRAETARFAADAKVAQRGDFETAAGRKFRGYAQRWDGGIRPARLPPRA